MYITLHLGRWTFATTVPWQWSWSVARVQAALRSRHPRRKGLQHRRLRPPPRAWRVWSWRRTRRVWRNNHIWVGDWDKFESWQLNWMWHQGIFDRVHVQHPYIIKLWYGWFGIGGDTAWKRTLHLRIDPYMYLQDLITKLKKLGKTQHTVTLRVHFNDVLFSICQILGPVFHYVYIYMIFQLIFDTWISAEKELPQGCAKLELRRVWNPEVLLGSNHETRKSPTRRFVQPVACYPTLLRIAKWQCPTWGSFLLPKMRSSLRQCGALAWKKWRDGWWTSVVEAFKKRDDKTIGKFVVAKNPWSIEGYNDSEDLSVKLHFFSLYTRKN